MAKIKIKKVPTSNPQIKSNVPEQDLQIYGNNPLDKRRQITNVDETVGNTYPLEKKGEGNVEAEKDEYIVKVNDNYKLFKIPGKSHKEGGSQIIMEEGDFIFSNNLKMKGDILKTEFNLSADKEYTFAEIAKKYNRMNEYQKLSESNQPLEKKTGELMVQKYKDKLARLAFLQESQKGMPNGIPEIVTPLLEKIGQLPNDLIPEDTMMKKGGQKTMYSDGGPFKEYTDKKSKTTYKVPEKYKSYTKEQIDEEFYTPEVLKFMAARDKEEGIDSDLGNAKDYTWGKRHQEAYDKFFKDSAEPEKTSVIDSEPLKKETFNNDLVPPSNLNTASGSYKDMGYSTAEQLALATSLKPIPSYAPTRYQNYGLEQALGALSNLMPYNYQSSINEATKSGSNSMNANNAFSRTPQAMVNNTAIAGQLAETTSKIKGEEYNQNANLYNNNQAALSQVMSAIGQDKEQQAQLYGDRVIQQKENLWANRRMRDKEFLAQFSNAENNRSLRNAYGYLGQSTNPNFQITNANNMVGFTAMQNPFDVINGYNRGTGKQQSLSEQYKAFSEQLKDIPLSEDKKFEYFMKLNKQIK